MAPGIALLALRHGETGPLAKVVLHQQGRTHDRRRIEAKFRSDDLRSLARSSEWARLDRHLVIGREQRAQKAGNTASLRDATWRQRRVQVPLPPTLGIPDGLAVADQKDRLLHPSVDASACRWAHPIAFLPPTIASSEVRVESTAPRGSPSVAGHNETVFLEADVVPQRRVHLRPAASDDADAIADVLQASFRATYAFPDVHTDGEVRRWIRDALLTTQEVWVATAPDGPVVAVMALSADMIEQLYVAPGFTGHGIGSRFVALAKDRRPEGLDLWTFQVNAGARRFYERNGFVEVTRTDGAGNEERQPDIRYAWRPAE